MLLPISNPADVCQVCRDGIADVKVFTGPGIDAWSTSASATPPCLDTGENFSDNHVLFPIFTANWLEEWSQPLKEKAQASEPLFIEVGELEEQWP
jgi:hypothetical protein